MQLDEARTRTTLRRTQESESSKNIQALNLSTEKFQSWLRYLKKDRPAQATLTTTVTDTAFRVFGDRLKCPHCPNQQLNMKHMIECPSLKEELNEAELYTKPDQSGRKSWAHTDLYVNFCSAARVKIGKMINDAKKNHEEGTRANNSNQATQ